MVDFGDLAGKALKQLGVPNLFGGDEDFKKPLYETARMLNLIADNLPEKRTSNQVDDRSDWWTITGANWHQTFPYSLVAIDKESNDREMFYTLPIPPQALSIKMVTASQVTPTIGGVVEETSANVFWMITMQGTTGTGIGRDPNDAVPMKELAGLFRRKMTATGETAGIFAQLGSAASKIGGIVNAFSKDWSDVGGGISSLSAGIQQTLLPNPPYFASAVREKFNGFKEIQELHRWLLVYSKVKGAYPNRFDLKFRMYKTNQEWMCAVQDFSIQQNAQNPHLYRYNIALKCWNVHNLEAKSGNPKAKDRFGANGDLASVNILSAKEAKRGLQQTVKNLSKFHL